MERLKFHFYLLQLNISIQPELPVHHSIESESPSFGFIFSLQMMRIYSPA